MNLTGSYCGGPGAWHATIKRDGDVIWTCPHAHRNRDQSSMSRGQAARSCAAAVLSLIQNPDMAAALDKWWNSSSRMSRYGDAQGIAQHKEAKRLAEEVRASL